MIQPSLWPRGGPVKGFGAALLLAAVWNFQHPLLDGTDNRPKLRWWPVRGKARGPCGGNCHGPCRGAYAPPQLGTSRFDDVLRMKATSCPWPPLLDLGFGVFDGPGAVSGGRPVATAPAADFCGPLAGGQAPKIVRLPPKVFL